MLLNNLDYTNEIIPSELLQGTITSYVNNHVTTIASKAIRVLSNLTYLELNNLEDIPGTVTFNTCSNLLSIKLNKLTTLQAGKFPSNLTTLHIPNVSTFGPSVLYNYTNLTSLVCSSILNYMGSGALYNTNISTFNFFGLTSIPEEVCRLCKNLTTVTISSGVTTIGAQAFRACSNLTTISGNNVSIISSSAFDYCASLSNINFPALQIVGNGAFTATALTTLSLSKVTTIEPFAFTLCSNLTTVSLPQVTMLSNHCFRYCYNLTTIYMPKVTTIGAAAFNKTSITNLDLSTNVNIGQGAFSECSNLSIINLPNVTTISASAFQQCTALTSAYLPQMSVIPDYCFVNTSLSSLTTASSSLTVGINGLANTKISYLSANSLYFGVAALQNCTSLTHFNGTIYSISDNTFQGCTALPNITLRLRSLYNDTFAGCSALTYVSLISSEYETYFTVQNRTFKDCVNLSKIYAEDGLNFGGVSTEASETCANCYKLDIYKTIGCLGDSTFYNCSSLKSIQLKFYANFNPGIGISAFTNCINLSRIDIWQWNYTPMSAVTLGAPVSQIFNNTPILDATLLGYYGSIYIPSILYSQYIVANYWSDISARLVSYASTPGY